MTNNADKPLSQLARVAAIVLLIMGYLIAFTFGILCVLYHWFFTAYCSMDGSPLSLLGVILALANLIYPSCIAGLFGATLGSKRWRSFAVKPLVWAAVVMMVPIMFYLNYILVESLGPYNCQT